MEESGDLGSGEVMLVASRISVVVLRGHTHLRNKNPQMRTRVELTVVTTLGMEGIL